MVDLRFSNNSGVSVTFRTDLINTVDDNLTVMAVSGLDTVTEQALFKDFKCLPNRLGAFKAFAVTNALVLDYIPVGAKSPSITTLNTPTLSAPSSLTATANSSTQITLNWTAVTNATGYVVERATNSGFTTGLTSVYTGAALTYVNTGLTTATQYYYRVKATGTGYTTSGYATANATTA